MENVNYSSSLSSVSNNNLYSNGSSPNLSDKTITLTWGKIFRYLAIIVILSILGLNLFSYLGIATDFVSKITAPFVKLFGLAAAETTKAAVNVGATGVKAGADIVSGTADVVAGAVTGGVNVLETTLTNGLSKNNIDNNSIISINNALNNAEKEMMNTPMPDDTGSEIQRSKIAGKTGYCFIGEDRGVRSCVEVTESDKCMSGDIFPTREICINPSLRQ